MVAATKTVAGGITFNQRTCSPLTCNQNRKEVIEKDRIDRMAKITGKFRVQNKSMYSVQEEYTQ
jgi:hypothetical protein